MNFKNVTTLGTIGLAITCCFVFPVFAAQSVTFETNQTTFANKMFADLVTKPAMEDRKQVITNFCNTALAHGLILEPGTATNTPSKLIYDPRQSVFLYFLCSHVDDTYREKFQFKQANTTFILDKLYLKRKTFDAFKLVCKARGKDNIRQPSGCVPGCEGSTDMNACDMSLFVPPIINTVLNDESNGALGIVYGVWSLEADIDELVNELAFKYFSTNLDNDTFPEYPKTKEHVKKFIKKARQLTKKTVLLDIANMMKVGNKKEGNQGAPTCNLNLIDNDNFGYDLFACIYSPADIFHEGEPVLRSYTNLMYNELMRYQLFATYRARLLRSENSLLPYAITERPTSEWQKLSDEAFRMEQELEITSQSLRRTIHTLTNLQSTFWVHVGLLMYYEEAIKFRNALAKIYTPLHQLYSKLRNVQAEK